jgi:hypothetical protein
MNLKNTSRPWLYVAIAIAVLLVGYLIYGWLHPPQPVTPMSQQQTETPQGVQQAAGKARVHINTDQAVEVAEAIEAAPARKPDRVVQTTGAQATAKAESERVKAGADFTTIADPKKPDKKTDLATIPADKPVVLNQYNITAYPRALLELTAYSDKSLDVAYLRRVKVFGATGYIGPAVLVDVSKIRVGVRLSVPL